jgi:hypothetical protein
MSLVISVTEDLDMKNGGKLARDFYENVNKRFYFPFNIFILADFLISRFSVIRINVYFSYLIISIVKKEGIICIKLGAEMGAKHLILIKGTI